MKKHQELLADVEEQGPRIMQLQVKVQKLLAENEELQLQVLQEQDLSIEHLRQAQDARGQLDARVACMKSAVVGMQEEGVCSAISARFLPMEHPEPSGSFI